MRNSETVEPISVHRPSLCLTKKGLSQVQAPVDLRVQPNDPSSFSMVDHLGSCWMTIAWSDSHPHNGKSWLKEFGYPRQHRPQCAVRWGGMVALFFGGEGGEEGFSLYVINWITGKWVCGHQGNLMEAMLVLDSVLRDSELIYLP